MPAKAQIQHLRSRWLLRAIAALTAKQSQLSGNCLHAADRPQLPRKYLSLESDRRAR